MADMILFGDNVPRLYRITDVYIYGEDDPSDLGNGKIVPAIDSIIVDNRQGPLNTHVYSVTGVDNEGDNPTYQIYRQEIFNTLGSNMRMINFSNHLITGYLEDDYYNNIIGAVTYKGTFDADAEDVYPTDPLVGDFYLISVTGTVDGDVWTEGDWMVYDGADWNKQVTGELLDRFMLDRRFALYSDRGSYYVLLDPDDTIISMNPDDLPLVGDGHVDLISTDVTNQWAFGDCAIHPDKNPGAGDYIKMRIYDDDDVMLTELNVYCLEAKGLGDLSLADNILINAAIIAPGETWNGTSIELAEDGDPEDLDIRVNLTYGDGTVVEQLIDDSVCFIYGLDDVDSTMVGSTFEFTVKYFLPNPIHSLISEAAGSERFVSLTGSILIV
jgi:hypothetical protein